MKIGNKFIGFTVVSLAAAILITGLLSLRLFRGAMEDGRLQAAESLSDQGVEQLRADVTSGVGAMNSLVERVRSDLLQLANSGAARDYVTSLSGRNETWNAMARREAEQITDGLLRLCETQADLMDRTMRIQLQAARYLLRERGGYQTSGEKVAWRAVNQLTQEIVEIELPEVRVGDTVVGQSTDLEDYSPVVDDLTVMTGATCTIFQRMNPQGDMLRVATTVPDSRGRRAIGTYIPARNPDGSANPVIEAILDGRDYEGRAFVVNQWYITAYSPLRNEQGKTVGVLYVGVPEASLLGERQGSLGRAISETKVGETGYPFVLDLDNYILVHPRPELVGLHCVDDLNVQEFAQIPGTVTEGEVKILEYGFEDRAKFLAYTLFPRWDWVVSASGYWDDIYQPAAAAALSELETQIRGIYEIATLGEDAETAPMYAQIRLLDNNGRELVKLQDGRLRSDLFDKSSDPWFARAHTFLAESLAKGAAREVFFLPVDVAGNTGRRELRVASALTNNEDGMEGMVVLNFDWRTTELILNQVPSDAAGYAFIASRSGQLLAHSVVDEQEVANMADGSASVAAAARQTPDRSGWLVDGENGRRQYMAYQVLHIGPTPYLLAAAVPATHMLGVSDTLGESIGAAFTRAAGGVAAGMVVLAVLGGLLAARFSAAMVRPLHHILAMANEVAAGGMPPPSKDTRQDEFGDLSRAFDQIVAATVTIVDQARQIAKGQYDLQITPRSDQDALSDALIAMTASLKQMDTSAKRDNWLKTGLNELNELMGGEQDLHVLLDKALSYLAKRSGAGVGAIFLLDGEQLRMRVSYAYTRRKEIANCFELGEGLVGQAALEGKPIVVERVPEDYLVVRSGCGASTPAAVTVHPLLQENERLGILELGFLHPLEDDALAFVELVLPALSVAVHSCMARERMNHLLETTREQAAELRQQQEELQQTNAELEERTEALEEKQGEVQRKNDQIEKSRAELECRARELELSSQYKSDFLANMSHELRTPLNSLLILSGLLKENKDGNMTERQVEFANTIHTSGNDLLNLINDVLDLAKVESGKIEFTYDDVRVVDVGAELERSFRHVAEQKGVRFNIALQPEAPEHIRVDFQRLMQILRNLLSNAIKFTDQGEIELGISPVTGHPAGPSIAFAVKDTGIGVPEDKLAVIFEAFQQADGSTNRKYGGTGLGLSIARQYARHMGGVITLHSEEGKGSTFTLILPVEGGERSGEERAAVGLAPYSTPSPVTGTMSSRPAVARAASVAAPSVLPAPSQELTPPAASTLDDDRAAITPDDKVLLVVEDDQRFALIMLDLAREKGFKVVVALNGEEGVRLAKELQPCGIILDLMLPGMDGKTAMQLLKDDPDTRHIPIHVVSALDQMKTMVLRMGAIGFQAKPVSVEQLNRAFSDILEMDNHPHRKVLIVEDDVTAANSVRELISGPEIEAMVVHDGTEAIAQLATGKFDCVILDLGLRGKMDGFEVLQKANLVRDGRRVPVIIHTGRDLSSSECMKLRQFADSVIVKGAASPERLLDEVTLFLHVVESSLSPEKREMLQLAHDPERALSGRRVLVVDDDMRNVFSMTAALEGVGVEVLPAENGAKALEVLQETPDVDLVLMDIMMPVMDGYEAMRTIRKRPAWRRLPIIALTAKAMRDDREKCIQAGASDYLSKPVDMNKLLSLLRVWLNNV